LKRLSLICLLLLAAIPVNAETHVPAGPVSGTWTLAGSPYIIEGNIVVESSGSLTIAAGVSVIMNVGSRFRVEGRLLAIGTVNDSILFLAADTSIGSEGVHFLNTNFSPLDSSRLAYCEFSYGVATVIPDPYMHGGGVYVKNSSRLLIDHCYFHHCRTLDAYGANGVNGSGGYPTGNPGTPGSQVKAGNGGALYIEACAPQVMYCTFAYNRTGNGYGGDGGHGAAVNDTTASNLTGGAGGLGGAGYGGTGGAISLKNSAAILQNNVIHNNYTGSGFGGRGGVGGNAAAQMYANGGVGGAGGSGFGGDGGAIFTDAGMTQMDINLIYANTTGGGSGGIGGNGGTATVSEQYYWTATPGAGGIGANGYGGDGYALYAYNAPTTGVRMSTITGHYSLSAGQGGLGGLSGGGVQAPSGQGFTGTAVVGGALLLIANSIVWDNADPFIDTTVTIAYSDIQGGHVGTGIISANPLFVNSGLEAYYLSQIVAGQIQNSPCVDAGNPTSFLVDGTTRTDGIQDFYPLDMGYHYPLTSSQIQISITLNPVNPPIQIPASGGTFRFNAMVANGDTMAVPFDAWIMQRTPTGVWQGPMLGPVDITLAGGASLSRLRAQNVPSTALPGVYTYKGYAGLYPEVRWDSSGFTYEKLTTGAGPMVNDWICTGDPFPGEAISTPEIYPLSFRLNPPHPNPFNGSTALSFNLPQAGWVRLEVCDIMGRSVGAHGMRPSGGAGIGQGALRAPLQGWFAAGQHEVTFDGSQLASGVYLVRLEMGDLKAAQKVVLLK
jgi:hypothetical protein